MTIEHIIKQIKPALRQEAQKVYYKAKLKYIREHSVHEENYQLKKEDYALNCVKLFVERYGSD